jgi:starch synthase
MIYAGSDILIVPSMFEPCGLTQMIALRYGTVPVVRSVGGLADTVFDFDYADCPVSERNGYDFHQTDHDAIESALERAIGLWFEYPDRFRELIVNGMRNDYSWNFPGQNYLNVYNYIRHS